MCPCWMRRETADSPSAWPFPRQGSQAREGEQRCSISGPGSEQDISPHTSETWAYYPVSQTEGSKAQNRRPTPGTPASHGARGSVFVHSATIPSTIMGTGKRAEGKVARGAWASGLSSGRRSYEVHYPLSACPESTHQASNAPTNPSQAVRSSKAIGPPPPGQDRP